MPRYLFRAGVLLLAAGAARGDVLWEDDFRRPARYERHAAQAWRLQGGQCGFRAGSATAMLLPPIPALGRVVVEAEVTPKARLGAGWTYAGISAYLDPGNYWQLILAEGPDGKRYCTLVEDLGGMHQAQSTPGPTNLRSKVAGELAAWEYARRYRLRLSLGAGGIEGTVTDVAGGAFWRQVYPFVSGRALREGRPALTANGTAGVFHRFRVEGSGPGSGGALALARGPAGSVAILRDQGNRVAPGLARAFRGAGYGVTLLDWGRIDAGRLRHDKLDLLVLADARRLPVGARDAVVHLLTGAGRVIAIGAPALSEVLAPTADGWAGPAEWRDAYARRLPRTPLPVAADDWTHASYAPAQPSRIAPDPAGGADCWKVEAELQGWDTFALEKPAPFGEARDLLLFEARGDARTRQMCVECTEEDGSRWIGTVDLTPRWRSYVLRPTDFPFWNDSRSRGRGGAGDCLRPRNVVRITFGLAASHTPKVAPGPHAYWIRGLATASDAGGGAPSFVTPDIPTVCPSYALYPIDQVASLRAAPGQRVVPPGVKIRWKHAAYGPVWREQGRGFRRGRAWRWVPLLDAHDARGRKRGSPLSLAIGDSRFPNAVWANVAVADPAQALDPGLLPHVLAAAKAMARGRFLLEGGAELFSYRPGEAVVLGARAANAGRSAARLMLEVVVRDAAGRTVFQRRSPATVAAGRDGEAAWAWRPRTLDRRGYTVEVTLREGSAVLDRVGHRIEALRATPARPAEFVRVKGSHFVLGGKPWFFKGINYWPTWVAGYQDLDWLNRERYDPEIIERDLTWLQSIGINALSGIQALQPLDPDDPKAYRDQLDFLERCDRHGMKCFFIVPHARPYAGEDVRKAKAYIQRAGMRGHPAILCWELAWEPIEGPWRGMDFMLDEWNDWVAQRYGSADNAVRDWGFDLPRTDDGRLTMPTTDMCLRHGEWDRCVAAFRRAFSDIISARYREVVQPLRAWDPRHLISFRGGACGIPWAHAFAHIHSVGVARHMDFLNPEGYNLQTNGWAKPTPPDDIRRGGLVTLYYRFITREKPVVWMEFGFTVNGFQEAWQSGRVRVPGQALEQQRQEYERFYAMFIESGARGAAPWWLPGGFRLGENSDFGLLEPDGRERPACQVLRKYLPRFERVQHLRPDHTITLDLDRHYADSWETYSKEYLGALKAGKVPGLRTAGTGTDSATCPLTAVGGVPCTGTNPPQFLNAEFDRIEVRAGDGPWRAVRGGERVAVPRGARVLCRAAIGNLGEAKWLAPAAGAAESGRVFLAGRREYGLEFRAPVAADTPFLAGAEVREFTLLPSAQGEVTVSFEMLAAGRTPFGERRTVILAASPEGDR